jgi:hypothetical protein
MKSKAEGKSYIAAIDKIFAIINTKSIVTPQYEEINKIHMQAQKIITDKQNETRKLAEQIKNNYD